MDSSENGPSADSVGDTEFVQVVVRAASGRSDEAARLVGTHGGDVRTRHENLVQARVPASAVEALGVSPAVEFVRRPREAVATDVTSEGLSNMDVGTVHGTNYTGENTTVAVVDLGFDVTNPEIADQVVDWRNFSSPESPRTMANESGLHGTGTAELVAETAPNASIIAVKVNYPLELYDAIDWIKNNTSADVVSMSVGWYNVGPLDGSAEMNREIRTSVESGTPWVVSAGNEADGNHWNGTWSNPDGDQWMNFRDSDERMNVTPAGGSGTLRTAISWNDWPVSHEDYDAILVNESGDVVDFSVTVQNGTQQPTEYIYHYATQNVYLKLRNDDANESADFDVFFRGSADPEYDTAARSVTIPATGPRVITVGAAYYGTNELEDFSSRGPTIDGRRKPDVVAPDGVSSTAYPDGFYGTSAATPHTAGVAALMLDADPTLTPAEVKERLRSSAVPLRGTEPNNRTGYGLVDADGAIRSVEERYPDRVTYSGSVSETDGDPAVNDPVRAYALDSSRSHSNATDAAGNFSIDASGGNDSYVLGYYQGDSGSLLDDGSPDLQALDLVNGSSSTDLGDVTLPQAHVLNVTVVDETGTPVPNADVEVADFVHEGGDHAYVSHSAETDADGKLVVGAAAGIELSGDVRVMAAPPDGSSRFAGANYSDVIDVQSDTNVTLTLNGKGATVSGRVTDADENPSADDGILVASDATGYLEVVTTDKTGRFTATGVEEGDPYSVGYFQNWSSDTAFPEDGIADIYTLARVNVTGDVDVGTRTVPNASLLNVRIVDESGDPVTDAPSRWTTTVWD
ncbi:S8 family serine peptidase [Halorussus sp. MSC15.2]|uniref:S8 family serine peptidase n=1 Tax=Halorussus sp. MSC15.2 TaxID=2283638 RepID=UPI0013D0FECA|nr:S8 family serine peptidase [Halorussus sp. MSC15.2]NEU55287.1 S8 family serine peptidase [Halorussus sp. MSC15.2]